MRNDLKLRAKILFVLADLRERQQKLEEAKKGWGSYRAYLKGKPKGTGYPATPAERKKRIVTWVDMQEPYAAVKERIQKRLAELEAKTHKGAK